MSHSSLDSGEEPALAADEPLVRAEDFSRQLSEEHRKLAHDINNALQHLTFLTEDIRHTVALSVQQRADLERTLALTAYARDLTRQLLRNGPAGPSEPLDLNAIVQNLVATLPRQRRRPIRYELTLADPLHPIRANPHQIRRLVANLLSNANDAMTDGGTVTVVTANEKVDEHLASGMGLPRGGSYVRLTVIDTGPGISESLSALVFEPGFTTNPEGSSLGLGLAIVDDVAREAGGLVTLRPAMNTTFDVLLPAMSPCQS